MNKFIIILLSLLAIASCSSGKSEDLKSPCVGADDSPCGPRKPVNKWLI